MTIEARGPAVTGVGGKIGSALMRELRGAGITPIAWSRPDYDLDDPTAAARLVDRDRPSLVYHLAAWTDVDGCTLEPDLANRRNSDATAELARACAASGTALVYLSTHSVFDGDRTDGAGYDELDATDPPNTYGASKLAGERQIANAFGGSTRRAWIVRTAWIFGPPGNDFPTRIIAAADRLAPGAPLRVVGDEVGQPTSSQSMAKALVRLPELAPAGTYHLTNSGHVSRYEWARAILARCRPQVALEEILLADYERPSRPPRWGVLDNSRAASLGLDLGSWREALDSYLESICP